MDATLHTGYEPGLIGALTALHGRYYAQSVGFDVQFEAEVATDLAAFVKAFRPEYDGLWYVKAAPGIMGSIAIVGSTDGTRARLRWFLLDPRVQGHGFGTRLMQHAIGFCRDRAFEQVHLHTIAGLHAAHHLYLKFGFRKRHAEPRTLWGIEVEYQHYELML